MIKKIPLEPTIFELFTKCSNNFIFVGDLTTDTYQWSHNTVSRFSLPGECTSDPQIWKKIIFEEDVPEFFHSLNELRLGKKQQLQGEYRIITCDSPVYAKFNMWLVAAENKNTYFAGVIDSFTNQNLMDPVSGLRSSYDFRFTLSEYVKAKEPFGILIIGIDNFKQINDLHSYALGDEVLKQFANCLYKSVPSSATLYRLDGDGFGMLYKKADISRLAAVFVRFQQISMTPFLVQGINIPITISGAGCAFPQDGLDGDTLLRCARIALNAAKTNGGNQFMPYTKDIASRAKRELMLLEKLRESVNHNFKGFYLNYQPLIYAVSGELYGCEVLLRWRHPDFPQEVAPLEFVPVLENTGMIMKVGEWVIQNALKQCSKWLKYKPDFQMSINATCAQFEAPEFRFFVMDALSRERLSPNLITLELTESNKISDTDAVSHAFDFFRGQGIKIAFDDFGMGYASLDIFRVLRADELKIDKSFLERLSYDVTDQKIIGHLISLCSSMNMNVCVEGVETGEVLKIIQQLGPTLLQGYYYNHPMSAGKFEEYYFLNENHIDNICEPAFEPAHKNTMVYSDLKPVQPLTTDELMDSSYAGIFQMGLDPNLTLLTCNEGFRRMLGCTIPQMEKDFQNHFLEFVHQDDREYVNKEIRRQLGTGDVVTIEYRLMRMDATPLWVMSTANVVRSSHGFHSLSVVTLVTDSLKKHAIAVQNDYTKAKKILENIPTGLKCVRYDSTFTIDYISPAFLSMMGYNETEINTKFQNHYLNLVYEEDRPQLFANIFEQLKESNIISLKYRSPCKDGRLIWLETVSRLCPPDEDGIQRCYSCIVSINESNVTQAHTNAANMGLRYQMAASQWGDILFECNINTRHISFSDEYRTMFGRFPNENLDKEIAFIHPDDRDLLLKSLQKIGYGERCVPIEIRIMAAENNYLWCCVYFNDPDRLESASSTILGKICNIDSEKRERDVLVAQSQRDPLTGLLNKSTLEEKIRIALSVAHPWEDYALFMIDIDDFKTINDTKGHPFGDEVLRSIGAKLGSLFKETDLVGRAGGDEFMAFIRTHDFLPVNVQAQRVMNVLAGEYVLDSISSNVTFSIGISCFPIDGTTFYDLFRHSDSALYHAKARGKNQFCQFLNALNHSIPGESI